jgi:hypothetical protein
VALRAAAWTRIKYLRRATSDATGYGLSTAIKHLRGTAGIGLGTTIIYLRCTTSAARGDGLGATINYLRGAASNGLGTTIKYLRCTTIALPLESAGRAIPARLSQLRTHPRPSGRG